VIVPTAFFDRLGNWLAWPNRKATGVNNAWCDGLLINGSPWHCLCCQKLRGKLTGAERSYLKECNERNLGVLGFQVVVNQWGERYVWPAEKHVYPSAELLGR
jgi:hypothetical protein